MQEKDGRREGRRKRNEEEIIKKVDDVEEKQRWKKENMKEMK